LTPGSLSIAPSTSSTSAPSTQQTASETDQKLAQRSRTIPGMGDHLLRRKERRVAGENPNEVKEVKGEFNFEQNLKDFDKEKEFSQLSIQESKVNWFYLPFSPYISIRSHLTNIYGGRELIKNLPFLIPSLVMHLTV
jgi:hypothetical protein